MLHSLEDKMEVGEMESRQSGMHDTSYLLIFSPLYKLLNKKYIKHGFFMIELDFVFGQISEQVRLKAI